MKKKASPKIRKYFFVFCVHQASTFDSPKKEKRLPRKWRTKNYNKDVKTTLQVINVTNE